MLLLKNISFSYLEEKTVINNLSLVVEKGQHVALLGESGCGKSTLLKLIYGLQDLDQGEIHWNNKQVLGPAYHLVPGIDEMRYLAQDFDLMPFTSVKENIGKYLSNFYMEEKEHRIKELLTLVDLDDYADVKVKHLSGGQQQRVAIARVLALEPEILLLDEPFSHIDYSRRSLLRRNLFAYLKEKGITCIVATHDSIDALSFADETIVLKDGELVDMGETKDVYEFPLNKYVASLFGEVNELYISDFTTSFEEDELLLIYPHQLMLSKQKGQIEVEVLDSYFKGDGYMIKTFFNEDRVVFFDHPFDIEKGTKIKLALKKFQ
ncbi:MULTISPECIES: ABC transporter ATP-binding protein [Myroides]|uniref:ABC transporter ATP-binding protein n=1 Tax=Myroides odoratimimus TaxID=76832 RepID=A0AAI8G5D9_9FLAO|nr:MULTISPECIES: ABC transporter ATP-binding protein [Myroides]ALU26646.1 ABC transporter ATP-binding protein [Myroides odoratimimus]APA92659.1 ABC transporter ATP-binding protein [Myroides sp. ZB35]MDM1035008.1 ABC transporter ATP-binding protein [Myroides odoratimimus]MDM1037880.1 ABC transporter ATP-binding protein [Myroides odoratimimus]MDM1051987.1 ABC transporter ATP-binding protein [Myroides odoratimimus]